MISRKLAGLVPPAVAILSAFPARAANTCNNWWDQYDGNRYNGIGVALQTQGGPVLQSPLVVMDFWGSLNPRSATYSGQDQPTQSLASTMFNDTRFWSRYSQYNVTQGSSRTFYHQ